MCIIINRKDQGKGKAKLDRILSVFDQNPVIDGERILLRKIDRLDAEDMYEYSKDPEVTRYLLWNPHPSIVYTKRYVEDLKRQYREHTFFDFAVVLKEKRKMIGTCGFTRLDPANRSAEIGYVLSPAYWNRGLAAEAVGMLLRWAFCDLFLNRVEARYMVENTRSRAVMEKNGMSFEGVRREGMLVKGSFRDIGICSILRREFVERFGDFSSGYREMASHRPIFRFFS